MAGIFRIHAVAVGEPYGPSVFTLLEKFFMEVCESPKTSFDDASVYWHTAQLPSWMVYPTDAVVWLLPDKKSSVIKKVYQVTPPSKNAGLTKSGSKGTISEIYLDHPMFTTASSQAKMAFHELMHNKTRMGDEMHGQTLGLGRERLDTGGAFSVSLTGDDIALLAPTLDKPVPQYLGK